MSACVHVVLWKVVQQFAPGLLSSFPVGRSAVLQTKLKDAGLGFRVFRVQGCRTFSFKIRASCRTSRVRLDLTLPRGSYHTPFLG